MSGDGMTNDALLRELGGCGLFQVAICCLLAVPYFSSSFSLIFMTFGVYNPGWRCVDNHTTLTPNDLDLDNNTAGQTSTATTVSSLLLNNQTSDLFSGSNSKMPDYSNLCEGYDKCSKIEFNPEASTIATEWNLICSNSWTITIILAVQMVGATVGSFSAGYLGDTFGRKVTIYGSVFIQAIMNFVCIFSVNWEMFAVIRFILTFTGPLYCTVIFVYMNEFVAPKWRMIATSLPFWYVGCILFSVYAIIFKNWKYMHITNGVVGLLSCLPFFVFPESLRWLSVKGKPEETKQAIKRIANWNKTKVSDEIAEAFVSKAQFQDDESKFSCSSFPLLFQKSTRTSSFVLGLNFFTINLIYFSTTIGISVLPGNVYTNVIILFATELPANIFCWCVPNAFGRKRSVLFISLLELVCLVLVIVLDRVLTGSEREVVMVAVIAMVKVCVVILFYIFVIYSNEIYPTRIRSTATGYGLSCMFFGSIMSSFIVPKDASVLYISFTVMAVALLVCTVLILLLPETLGKDLKDTIESEESGNEGHRCDQAVAIEA